MFGSPLSPITRQCKPPWPNPLNPLLCRHLFKPPRTPHLQVSRLQDPNSYGASYVVAEVDVTNMVESRATVSRLQDDMEALLREILPEQVGSARSAGAA